MMKQKVFVQTGVVAAAVMMLAGGARAEEQGSNVEKCSKKLGVIAVAEPQTGWHHLSRYGLGSPEALLRMMIQQSGCFDVVERGVAMQNLQQERALGQSGDLRQESNVGKGQMQAADFVMTPNVQVAASDTGGIGGALMGRLGVLGAIAGGLKFKEASTSLLIADVRSSIQVAAAEGKATKTDFGIGGWAYGNGMLGALGGYTKTPEGKMVAASLLDNYNKIVQTIRDQPQLIRSNSASGDANAAASQKAEAPQKPGQTLCPKIANVKAYATASREGKVVATLTKNDELIASGELSNGFVFVDAANFSGWVQRTLVGACGMVSSAPQAQPLPVTQSLAGGIFGNFSGSFSGYEQGSFTVSILPGLNGSGTVTGSGVSNQSGAFSVSGAVLPNGRLTMVASGSAGSAHYQGGVDPINGTVSGTWSYGGGMKGGGSFSGQRS